ncbi:MAG: M23 family metallopeptidase [Maribacter sp.]|uniref:M23 family metallopeptidase n=1 Tax=Maribacter sp. TaxID=1897614 RepID=UPI0032996288
MKPSLRLTTILSTVLIVVLTSCADTLIGDQGQLDEDVYFNYQAITDLELPFEEEWYLTAGGRTHADGGGHFFQRESGQRYAYDMIKIEGDRAATGDGSTNEDAFGFGARINAPADGVIISVENSIDDNLRPGFINPNINNSNLGGNYIMIDHLNGEYSLLAHFKKGSIIVAVGDTVVQGQEVGKAGNSGNSTGTHLHYQLQNTPDYLNGFGLPAQFQNYYEDDIFIARGEPTRDQKVRKN